jgi:hypothetical protein
MTVSTDPGPVNRAAAAHAPAPAPVDVIEAALRRIVRPGGVAELRALNYTERADGKFAETISGVFEYANLRAMAEHAQRLTRHASGVYVTLNPLKRQALALANNRVRVARKDETAADRDVAERYWLPVDIDPARRSGVSATDEEKAKARQTARAVYGFLRAKGWPAPLVADSGNGFHLLYRIALPADDGGFVKRCLEALAARFDNEFASVDTTLYNPARICKVYGTVARKGDATAERPHRLTRILTDPEGDHG